MRIFPLIRILYQRHEVRVFFGLVGVSDILSTFSIIRMNVNTEKRMFVLSQGVYLGYIWTLFFRKKCSMIWSLVRSVSPKDLAKPSVFFSIWKTKNKGPILQCGVLKSMHFIEILSDIRNCTEFSIPHCKFLLLLSTSLIQFVQIFLGGVEGLEQSCYIIE